MNNLEKLLEIEAKIPKSDLVNRAKIAKLKLALKQTCSCGHHHLSEFRVRRELSQYEKKVNFVKLSEILDDEEDELQDDLVGWTREQTERYKSSTASSLAKGALATFVGYTALKSIFKKSAKSAYEQGKVSATAEMNERLPSTPNETARLLNLRAETTANNFISNLNAEASAYIVGALSAGVAVNAILGGLTSHIDDISSKYISNAQGTIPMMSFNEGRRDVFDHYIVKIIGYSWSAILDQNTCNLCLSLDGRILKPDDPLVNLDVIHSSCRCLKIPILNTEETPKFTPIPKTIMEAFDTVGGQPIVNEFKQLKRPINKANAKAKQEIQRRLNKA